MKIESTFSFDATVVTANGTERVIPKSANPIKITGGGAWGIPEQEDGVTFLVNKKVYDDNPDRTDFAMWNPEDKMDTDGKTKYRSVITHNGIHQF